MTDMNLCDWPVDGGGFSRPCGKPASQWIVHSSGGNVNSHCHSHTVKDDHEMKEAGWLFLTRAEVEVLWVMES